MSHFLYWLFLIPIVRSLLPLMNCQSLHANLTNTPQTGKVLGHLGSFLGSTLIRNQTLACRPRKTREAQAPKR